MFKQFLLLVINHLVYSSEDIHKDTLCTPFGARMTLGYYYTGQNKSDMIDISFNTNNSCPLSYVLLNESGTITNYTNINTTILNMSQIYENYTGYNAPLNYTYFTFIKRLSLGNLTEGNTYQYQLFGNYTEQSQEYYFTVPYRDIPDNQTLIFFGDIDSQWNSPNASSATFDWFQLQVQNNATTYSAFVLLGDQAYDQESSDCYRGDYFLRNLSATFAPYFPLITVPGNHDAGNNTQFPMLQGYYWSPQLMINTNTSYFNFYSYNLGYAHFINFNPYWMVYNYSTSEQNQVLYEAFLEDLTVANTSRIDRPWIIVTCHYPIYCSDPTNPMCSANYEVLSNYTALFQLFKVDLFINAHQHDYERDTPTYNNQTANFTSQDESHIIIDSTAPIYITEGAAGNNYYFPDEIYQVQPYTVVQSVQYGVGRLTIQNQTYIYWEQIDTTNNSVIDYLSVIKQQQYAAVVTVPQTSNTILWIFAAIILIAGCSAIGYLMWRKHQKNKDSSNELTEQQLERAYEITP